MPPQWSKKPDRKDPEYRKIDDRMNLALHVAIFTAVNSGMWFFRDLQFFTWGGTIWVTGIWGLLLTLHLLYILAIADYSVESNG